MPCPFWTAVTWASPQGDWAPDIFPVLQIKTISCLVIYVYWIFLEGLVAKKNKALEFSEIWWHSIQSWPAALFTEAFVIWWKLLCCATFQLCPRGLSREMEAVCELQEKTENLSFRSTKCAQSWVTARTLFFIHQTGPMWTFYVNPLLCYFDVRR